MQYNNYNQNLEMINIVYLNAKIRYIATWLKHTPIDE